MVTESTPEGTIRQRILIADDSELNRDILTEILGDSYEYCYAENGEEVLEKLSIDMDVDMVLLDMNMPRMSGMEVLKVMNQRDWTKEIPVIIISEETDVAYIRTAYKHGATDYIERPFNSFLIQHRVENTLALYTQKNKLSRLVEHQIYEQEKRNRMLVNIFGYVVESVNHKSGNHTFHVQTITNLLLKHLVKMTNQYSLSETDISIITSVSALHDIGKIAVPKDILEKPGSLTDAERNIMQLHTIYGKKMLENIPMYENEQFLVLAREICRWHHERYDGSGYPDGLQGEQIPISAQVVALADVYDALTSERCYKKAIPHEQAVQMIVNGECGMFNPILIRCFKEVADEIMISLHMQKDEAERPNDMTDSLEEIVKLSQGTLHNRSSYMAGYEREKKDFFASMCEGIQFEYDSVMRKILYIHYYDSKGNKIKLPSNSTLLLKEDDWEAVKEKVSAMTKETPTVVMNVTVAINGMMRWQKLTVHSIWAKDKETYVSIVGQLTDIHDVMVGKENSLSVNQLVIGGKTLVSLKHLFDIVRIVNPKTTEVLNVDEFGNVVQSGRKCYEMWNRKEACQNCSAKETLKHDNWISKLEMKESQLYSVYSKRATFGGQECVLEVAMRIEDDVKELQPEIGFCPDAFTLQNFYKDSLTKTYSRAYLENFASHFEQAQGVIVVDVDKFKEINDTYGHMVGDAALKHISSVMKSCLREEDIVIRYGGDEFLVILKEIEEGAFYQTIQRIKKQVQESVFEKHPEVHCSVSVGGAYCVTPFTKAIEDADRAMYQDKFNEHI